MIDSTSCMFLSLRILFSFYLSKFVSACVLLVCGCNLMKNMHAPRQTAEAVVTRSVAAPRRTPHRIYARWVIVSTPLQVSTLSPRCVRLLFSLLCICIWGREHNSSDFDSKINRPKISQIFKRIWSALFKHQKAHNHVLFPRHFHWRLVKRRAA